MVIRPRADWLEHESESCPATLPFPRNLPRNILTANRGPSRRTRNSRIRRFTRLQPPWRVPQRAQPLAWPETQGGSRDQIRDHGGGWDWEKGSHECTPGHRGGGAQSLTARVWPEGLQATTRRRINLGHERRTQRYCFIHRRVGVRDTRGEWRSRCPCAKRTPDPFAEH